MNACLPKYSAFFGRDADIVLQSDQAVPASCCAYRFPPTRVGFLRSIFTPFRHFCVYMTDGMSCQEMTIPAELQTKYPKRVEILACTKNPITGGIDNQDVVTRLLQVLATTVFRLKTFVGPVHTIDLGEKICTNSEMTGFFFALPDGIDMARLCRCTHAAQLILSVMPVTAGELTLAREKGPSALIAEFERKGVENIFDPFRKGIV